jgi:lipoprotein signal peptidase
MSTLKLALSKAQHSVLSADIHDSLILKIEQVAAISLLVICDQATKIWATDRCAPVLEALANPNVNLALGYHLHAPNPYSVHLAILAFCISIAIWMLPVTRAAKILWTAAALSNHLEMLVRPGTVDFIAFAIGNSIWVFNVADIFFGIGVLLIAGNVIERVRTAPTWHAPINC